MFLGRDINFRHVHWITHGKSLPAFCEMMERKTEIWPRRRLILSDALLSFYFQNKIKKQERKRTNLRGRRLVLSVLRIHLYQMPFLKQILV